MVVVDIGGFVRQGKWNRYLGFGRELSLADGGGWRISATDILKRHADARIRRQGDTLAIIDIAGDGIGTTSKRGGDQQKGSEQLPLDP